MKKGRMFAIFRTGLLAALCFFVEFMTGAQERCGLRHEGRRAAIEYIEEAGESADLASLRRIVLDPNAERNLRGWALNLLASEELDEKLLNVYRRLARGNSPDLALSAAARLAYSHYPEGEKALQRLILVPGKERVEAAAVLARLGRQKGFEILIEESRSQEFMHRHHAMMAMGRLLEDSTQRTSILRLAMIESLARLATEEPVSWLRENSVKTLVSACQRTREPFCLETLRKVEASVGDNLALHSMLVEALEALEPLRRREGPSRRF